MTTTLGKFLGKGTIRKSNAGGTRESNFDIRFANYTKTTKLNTQEKVSQFSFTAGAMAKTGLNLPTKAAAPYEFEDGSIGIAVVPADHEAANFFKPAKASAQNGKSKVATIPALVEGLNKMGILDTDFQGSQYFDLEKVSDEDGIQLYSIGTSAKAPNVYGDKGEEDTTSTFSN